MTGSGATGGQLRATVAEQFAQAHAELLSDDSIQFDLPVYVEPKPPEWLKPLSDAIAWLAPYMIYLFWGAVISGAAIILFLVFLEARGIAWRWPWQRMRHRSRDRGPMGPRCRCCADPVGAGRCAGRARRLRRGGPPAAAPQRRGHRRAAARFPASIADGARYRRGPLGADAGPQRVRGDRAHRRIRPVRPPSGGRRGLAGGARRL